MDAPLNQVLIPTSFNELFLSWNHFPDAIPYAGGTGLINKQEKEIFTLPPIYLSLEKIEDMHRIARTEQYLEIGAMVNLSRLLYLGKIVPEVIRTCLENIGGVQLRNIATIGGNICGASRLLDLPAPLTAMDARYELRSALGSRWVLASRFHTEKNTTLDKQELLTRIRLPLYNWDYSIYKKLYNENQLIGEALVFLAKAQKNILSDIRVVYKANSIFRNKEGEAILNGKKLPLNKKNTDDFVDNWKEFLSDKHEESEFSKSTLLNCIEENVHNLSE